MNAEPLILNIETSTTMCSVAVSKGEELLASRAIDTGYTHAENLHLFISEALKSAGCSPQHLSAVALSSGPGSYTGLRIGSSSAKGLCYALSIPLITINTLQLMASTITQKDDDADVICAMLDAGRMEVYTAVFDKSLVMQGQTQALVLDKTSIEYFRKWPRITFGGSGMEKARMLLEKLKGSEFVPGVKPLAENMAVLSTKGFRSKNFTQISDFEPFYLKNFMAGKKKTNN